MHPKSLLLDAAFRSAFICRSCLTTLRKQQATTPPGLLRPYAKASRRVNCKIPPPRALTEASRQRVIENDRVIEKDGDKGYIVRYFDQDSTGKRREVKNDEEDEADDDEIDLDNLDLAAFEAEVNRKYELLEATLGKMEVDNKIEDVFKSFGPEAEERFKQELIRSQGPEADKLLRQTLAETGIAFRKNGSFTFPQIDLADLKMASRDRERLTRLNARLRRIARVVLEDDVSQVEIASTWRRYYLSKEIILKYKDRVPPSVWDLLWKVFAWPENNPNRMTHIYHLSRNMDLAGMALSDERQLMVLEAMFIEGLEKEAIENWRKLVTILGSQKHVLCTPYWELGVRMLSLHGDAERAERASDTLFAQSTNDFDPRVLLHVIRACAAKRDTVEKSFTVYRRLRELLGPSMKIEDYDEVIACFLAAGRTDFGMYAFVDMMFAGTVDLRGRSQLPSAVSNYFFMGKWLKKLIGAGDLDGALAVLIYMQSKGILPGTVHTNWLVGAWLRSGAATDRAKAEELAWAMIRSRRTFVELRHRTMAMEWPVKILGEPAKSLKNANEGLNLNFVPRASLDTFLLMASSYQATRQFQRLEELYVAFKQCEIDGDADLMNMLIESAVEQRQSEKARALCRVMVDEYNILPNAHTYYILFKSLSVNRIIDPRHTQEMRDSDKVLCRQLFRDLLGSSWILKNEKLNEIQVNMILHSFRKCHDHVGMLVVLQALKEIIHFQVSPGVLLGVVGESETVEQPSPRMRKQVLRATQKVERIIIQMGTENVEAMGSNKNYAIMQTSVRAKIKTDDANLHEMYRKAAGSMGIVSDQFIDWGKLTGLGS